MGIKGCTCLITEPTWNISVSDSQTSSTRKLKQPDHLERTGLNGGLEVAFPALTPWLTTGFVYLLAVPTAAHLILCDNYACYLEWVDSLVAINVPQLAGKYAELPRSCTFWI